jgi:hypothetical protein
VPLSEEGVRAPSAHSPQEQPDPNSLGTSCVRSSGEHWASDGELPSTNCFLASRNTCQHPFQRYPGDSTLPLRPICVHRLEYTRSRQLARPDTPLPFSRGVIGLPVGNPSNGFAAEISLSG